MAVCILLKSWNQVRHLDIEGRKASHKKPFNCPTNPPPPTVQDLWHFPKRRGEIPEVGIWRKWSWMRAGPGYNNNKPQLTTSSRPNHILFEILGFFFFEDEQIYKNFPLKDIIKYSNFVNQKKNVKMWLERENVVTLPSDISVMRKAYIRITICNLGGNNGKFQKRWKKCQLI